ncbi:MAG: hypothetical protein WC549_00040 [Actinomycetota bacterium]
MNKVIADFDDFEDNFQKNGLSILFYWRSKYPGFKATLFTIPAKTSVEMIDLLKPHSDWLELGVHGFSHNSNFECLYWDEKQTNNFLDYVEFIGGFVKVFKAPGWEITYPQPYNELPNSEKPVNSNPQLVYNILMQRGYVVADQHYNWDKRPQGLKTYCTCHPWQVHGHTWKMENGEPNGLEQIEQAGVPWNDKSEFYFISEAWDKGLIKPCL